MKLWFAKFRISTALDEKKPLSPSLRRAIGSSEELRRFENNANAVHRALEGSPPPVASPELHRDIMRAVRLADRSDSRPSTFKLPRWIPATAVSLLALLGVVWFAMHRPARLPSSLEGNGDQSFAAATTVLQEGGQMIRTSPSAAMEPLVVELARVQRDLDGAAQFLLASLP